MKKGIRCNEIRYTNGKDRNRICFEFVSDDGVTPSSCTIGLGDIDPMTGERITCVTILQEYYKVVDHEVRTNQQASQSGSLDLTPAQKARRDQLKKDYIDGFITEHGYAPSKDDVRCWLKQKQAERWHLSLDSFVDEEDGSDDLERHAAFSVPAFADREETIEEQALREVAESLTGRKAEVYEAMVQRAAGGQVRLRFGEIAKKWGVAPKQITMDQERIIKMVRKRAEELRREEEL